jgi:hypothetical protein
MCCVRKLSGRFARQDHQILELYYSNTPDTFAKVAWVEVVELSHRAGKKPVVWIVQVTEQ